MSVYIYIFVHKIICLLVPYMCFSKIDLRDHDKPDFLKPFVHIPEENMHF